MDSPTTVKLQVGSLSNKCIITECMLTHVLAPELPRYPCSNYLPTETITVLMSHSQFRCIKVYTYTCMA